MKYFLKAFERFCLVAGVLTWAKVILENPKLADTESLVAFFCGMAMVITSGLVWACLEEEYQKDEAKRAEN